MLYPDRNAEPTQNPQELFMIFMTSLDARACRE
jgi:hypothetical protein